MTKRILSTSWDEQVLATRNLLIESAGYEVVTTRDEQVFLELLRNEHFDAAVIGDSITAEVRAELVRNAGARNPRVPLIIFVRTPAEAQQFLRISDYVVEALDSPARFLSMLRSAVGDGQPSMRAS